MPVVVVMVVKVVVCVVTGDHGDPVLVVVLETHSEKWLSLYVLSVSLTGPQPLLWVATHQLRRRNTHNHHLYPHDITAAPSS